MVQLTTAQKNIRSIEASLLRPEVAWGTWILLMIIAILAIAVYATDSICEEARIGYGVGFLLIFLVTIVLLAIYVPKLMRANEGTQLLLREAKNAEKDKAMIAAMGERQRSLYLHFAFLGVITAILAAILTGLTFAAAGCPSGGGGLTETDVDLASTYSGTMVASVVLTIVFGFIIWSRVGMYYKQYKPRELREIRKPYIEIFNKREKLQTQKTEQLLADETSQQAKNL